ncbi:MAG TPA: CBS domain-containing protein [Gammaproteobacteria bacterium]|nr:CBS domain-containing protein [Gammaproteobacteria bacterium]
MLASDVMTTEIRTLDPETRVRDALEDFWSGRLFEAPVTENGRIVGMLNLRHLIRQALPGYLLEEEMGDVSFAPDLEQVARRACEEGDKRVRDMMLTRFRTVRQDTALFAVATKLLKEDTKEAQHVAVVDGQGQLLGLVSEWEILRHIYQDVCGRD